jgi:hypothetical protein
MITQNDKDRIIAALTDLGGEPVANAIAFYPVPETDIVAVRVTDQPYNRGTADLLAEVIRPIVPVNSVASNSLYADDDRLGAVIFIRA